MTEIAALDARVTRLENQINSGFERIEQMLRQEIGDLKKEQISDLRELILSLVGDLREAHTRIADDQRRLWDRVVDLEKRETMRTGGHRMLSSIGHFLSAAVGGLMTWAVTWLSGSPPAHH